MFMRRYPLLLVAGLVVWAVWFVLLYSILSIACNVAPPATNNPWNWLNGSLLVMTLIVAAKLLYFAYYFSTKRSLAHVTPGSTKCFINWIAVAVFIVAAIATSAIGIMTLFFPPCI